MSWFGKRAPPEPPNTSGVPPGHVIKTCGVPPDLDPSLYRMEGGVFVVSLGHGSDEPVEELEGMLRQLEPQLAAPGRPVLFSREVGPLSLLFAPANPAIKSFPRYLLWVFNKPCLDGWLGDPARLQALLRRIYRLENSAQPVNQCVYFEHDSGPGAAVMARLLAGLGLLVRVPEPAPAHHLLLEVHRPEGAVLSVLVGRPFPLEGAVDTFPAAVNAAKAQAEARGDTPQLQHLEEQERAYLARVLQPLQSELHRAPLQRAPRLCRLLRAAVDQGGPIARRELEQELLGRKTKLLMLMNPDGRSTIMGEFPGLGPVLRVYPDMRSLRMTVKDLGLAEGSFVAAGIAIRDVFGWGAKQDLAVALNVYLTPQMPMYLTWSPAEARLMAQGQHATPAQPLRPNPPGPAPSDAFIAATMAVPGDRLTPEQIHSLLTDTDGFIEQGRFEKAFQYLRLIFFLHPENLDAHERAYRVYVASGNTQEAFAQLLNVLRLCKRLSEVQRAQPYLAALLEQQPHHPDVPGFLGVFRPVGRS